MSDTETRVARDPLREALTLLSIARGRVDACLAGRADMIVFQRLAEDLDAVAAALTASGSVTEGLDVERLAIEAAARLEGEVSRLRTELAACSEAYVRVTEGEPGALRERIERVAASFLPEGTYHGSEVVGRIRAALSDSHP